MLEIKGVSQTEGYQLVEHFSPTKSTCQPRSKATEINLTKRHELVVMDIDGSFSPSKAGEARIALE